MNFSARQTVAKKPPQSVKVVAKMVEDCVGSKPSRFMAKGINTCAAAHAQVVSPTVTRDIIATGRGEKMLRRLLDLARQAP